MTVITIKYVNPAKGDKKFGSIVDEQGTRYMVRAHMVNQFQEGQTYNVPTKPDKWGANTVQVVEAFSSPSPIMPAAAANAAPVPGYVPAPVLPIATIAAASPTAVFRPVPDVHKDRWIAFTGLVGRWVGSGNVVPSDLPTICDAVIREILRAEDQLK